MKNRYERGHHIEVYRIEGTAPDDSRITRALPNILKPRDHIWTEGSSIDPVVIDEFGRESVAFSRAGARNRCFEIVSNLHTKARRSGIYDIDVIDNVDKCLVDRVRSKINVRSH